MKKLMEWLVAGCIFGVTICLLNSLMGCCGPRGDKGDTVVGPAGERGSDGSPGSSIVGPQGPPGLDAQPVVVVPLCPGTSNYGVFVEVALLINGKLYAVYSQNGGFMTYLAPGNYTSNAIGSACNLTVNPDNTISH